MNNTENFYFAPVPEEFNNPEVFGNQFYYKLEINDEGDGNGTFTIKDTCGRYLPFDFSQVESLRSIINLLADSIALTNETR